MRRALLLAAAAAAACAHVPPEARAERVYIDGVAYYQKGDYARARRKWEKCDALAPAGSEAESDCRSGLDKIAQLLGEPAPSHPLKTIGPLSPGTKGYLDGEVYYKKGDYLKAGNLWRTCLQLAAPDDPGGPFCRQGLEKMQRLLGRSSTPPDGKK